MSTPGTLIYLLLLSATALVTIIKGIRHNVCQNVNVEGSSDDGGTVCDYIYIGGNGKSALNSTQLIGMEGLRGKNVRVVADNMMPYIKSNNSSADLGGFLGNTWNIIMDALQFNCTVITRDYDTGLEIIQSGKADVFLAATVAKKPLYNVTYSQPYFNNWYHLYMKAPEARGSSSSYLKTLDENLWIASLSMFLALGITLWTMLKILHNCHLKGTAQEPHVSIFSCLLAVCSGFLNQGYDVHLTRFSTRIIVIFSLIFGLLLYAAMNAVLVAKLAVFEIKLPFKSLEDVLAMKSYSLCVRTNSFIYNNFTLQDANRTVQPQWSGILNGPGCLNINSQDNLAKILCHNGLIILENRVVMAAVVRNYNITCKVTYLHQRYFETANYMLYRNRFEGNALIELYIKKMQHNGVMKRLSAKYVKTDLPEYAVYQKSPQVSMSHIDGILYMYLVAIGVSVLVLLVEFGYEKYLPRDNTNFEYVK